MGYAKEHAKKKFNLRGWSPARKGAFLFLILSAVLATFAGSKLTNPLNSTDSSGTLSTYSTAGGVDRANPFFQSLGTNGRSCGSCHLSTDAWSITPPDLQIRFNTSGGFDPVFTPVDGANCPSADVSTFQARRSAYSLLLNKGLIRISLPMPTPADGQNTFTITAVQDPYNCPQTTSSQPAMYRRPLPATNLDFLSAVMWDGRETIKTAGTFNPTASLTQQAVDATMMHAQASTEPTPQQLAQIVAFETALYTAQVSDQGAGSLTAHGATGGPFNLSTEPFYLGINDSLGGNPTGAPFNSSAFTLYDRWSTSKGQPNRQAVARGEALFNTLPIAITGVGGLNDALGQPVITGTCTTCHDAPNVGNHSFAVPLSIGTTAYPPVPALDITGLPIYTLQCSDGTTVQVTDPGRALITGNCSDIGKVKGPILRGLAGRAPYFHNGGAATLDNVVDFYNQRFNLNLTPQQQSDLVAFLKTL